MAMTSSFDRSSGVVYVETEVAQVQSMLPTWINHSTGRRIHPTKYRSSGQGSSTLQETILRRCVWLIDSFEPEALQFLGWHYASRIYERLKKNNLLSFKIWNIFRIAFPEEIDRLHHFYIPKDAPFQGGHGLTPFLSRPSQLPSIVNCLSKFNTAPLTYLWLQGYRIAIDDLMRILHIPTLAVLVLVHFPSSDVTSLSERDLKHWARAAQEASAFERLQVLVFRGFQLSSVEAILMSFSEFPALTLIGISEDLAMLKPKERRRGDWRVFSQKPSTTDIALNQENYAQAIFRDSKISMSNKMDSLYQLSKQFSKQSPASITTDPVVSIGYVGRDTDTISELPTWYYRHVTNDTVLPVKRPGSCQSLQQGIKRNLSQKRVVRKTKQVDMDFLLKSFH